MNIGTDKMHSNHFEILEDQRFRIRDILPGRLFIHERHFRKHKESSRLATYIMKKTEDNFHAKSLYGSQMPVYPSDWALLVISHSEISEGGVG